MSFENTTGTDPDKFLKKAKRLVVEQYNKLLASADTLREQGLPEEDIKDILTLKKITQDDVFVVWFAKTLQNWKALVATSVPDDFLYFEVTYDGEKKQTYVDIYEKILNEAIPDVTG